MCSSVVTLFNAAARAGLTIVERHEHSLYISRYPVGLDATVFGSPGRGQDLVFRNDTGHSILIKGIALKRSVTFEIWGVDVGRTVKFSEPVVTDKVDAKRYLEYFHQCPGAGGAPAAQRSVRRVPGRRHAHRSQREGRNRSPGHVPLSLQAAPRLNAGGSLQGRSRRGHADPRLGVPALGKLRHQGKRRHAGHAARRRRADAQRS